MAAGRRPADILVRMNDMTTTLARAVTIAGSDSGGGAGIQADLKTFAAYGVYGASAVTAVTAQNTLGVQEIEPVAVDMVVAQIESIVGDIGANAAKTGMLVSPTIVEAVAEAIQRLVVLNLVVDPVMVAKGGARLLDDEGLDAVREALIPAAVCVTPNLPEAEALLGYPVNDRDAMQQAARDLCELGAGAAVVKGGHLAEGQPLVDVMFDGHRVVDLETQRVSTRHSHGTGCTFSAAIAAGLARGWDLLAAVESAQDYVRRALEAAPGIGAGHGPLGHCVEPRRPPRESG